MRSVSTQKKGETLRYGSSIGYDPKRVRDLYERILHGETFKDLVYDSWHKHDLTNADARELIRLAIRSVGSNPAEVRQWLHVLEAESGWFAQIYQDACNLVDISIHDLAE